MKISKYYITYIALFFLLFTSCNKDEIEPTGLEGQDKIGLQFGALLNDFSRSSKQQAVPDCLDTDIADLLDPSYVKVALKHQPSEEWVAGINGDEGDFITVGVVWSNAKGWITVESPLLELPGGAYSLEYFMVYNSANQLLWVAPHEGGSFEDYVEDALPINFNLAGGADGGEKKYLNVQVLCFDERQEDAYGYLFFDFEVVTTDSYCIFVNYCEDNIHYPAKFSVEAWKYDGQDIVGSPLTINGSTMNTINEDPWRATVLCFSLPPLSGNMSYWIEVTIQSVDGLYTYNGQVPTFAYELSQEDYANQTGFEHLRYDCPGTDSPPVCDLEDSFADCDNDNILNKDENPGCELNPDPLCGEVEPDPCTNSDPACDIMNQDLENDCYYVYFDYDNQNNLLKIESAETDVELFNQLNEQFGKVSTHVDNNVVTVSLDGWLIDDLIVAYEIEVHPSDIDESVLVNCKEFECVAEVNLSGVTDRKQDPINITFDKFNYEYPYYIRVRAISCGTTPN